MEGDYSILELLSNEANKWALHCAEQTGTGRWNAFRAVEVKSENNDGTYAGLALWPT